MTRLSYRIAPPTDVIEASKSLEPDDISRVTIRIEATAVEQVLVKDLKEIRFGITVADFDADPDQLRQALTQNPTSIQPGVGDFGRWSFVAPEEAGNFVARPDLADATIGTNVLLEAGDTLVFYLRDVEVVERDGTTKIKVTEVPPDKDKSKSETTLTIRKRVPGLRIDYFTADFYSIKSGDPVELRWATTGASIIELLDQNGRSLIGNGPATEPEWHDAATRIFPQTTSTYTLKASSNDLITVATQQVTITVTDQLIVSTLEETRPERTGSVMEKGDSKTIYVNDQTPVEVGDFIIIKDEERVITNVEMHYAGRNWAALALTVDEPFKSEVEIGNNFTYRKFLRKLAVTPDGRIKDKTGYIMPVGSIIAYAGSEAPEGWLLCDGRPIPDGDQHMALRSLVGTHTPDLQDRFIMGAGVGIEPKAFGDPDQHNHSIDPPPTTFSTNNAGDHSHRFPQHWKFRNIDSGGYAGIDTGRGDIKNESTVNAGNHSHNVTLNMTSFASSNSSGANRPKWYAVSFIIKS